MRKVKASCFKFVTLLPHLYALPDEIIMRILKYLYMHDFRACWDASWISAKPLAPPQTIMQVSRYFRKVVPDMPRLWQCAHFVHVSTVRCYSPAAKAEDACHCTSIL